MRQPTFKPQLIQGDGTAQPLPKHIEDIHQAYCYLLAGIAFGIVVISVFLFIALRRFGGLIDKHSSLKEKEKESLMDKYSQFYIYVTGVGLFGCIFLFLVVFSIVTRTYPVPL